MKSAKSSASMCSSSSLSSEFFCGTAKNCLRLSTIMPLNLSSGRRFSNLTRLLNMKMLPVTPSSMAGASDWFRKFDVFVTNSSDSSRAYGRTRPKSVFSSRGMFSRATRSSRMARAMPLPVPPPVAAKTKLPRTRFVSWRRTEL